MNVFFIELPNILLINLFLSNLVIEVSFIVIVDCADVNRLSNSALADIPQPKPQLVIIFFYHQCDIQMITVQIGNFWKNTFWRPTPTSKKI